MFKTALIVAATAGAASAECANACNGHGRCTSYDMCVCNRNWQANDCSERICQYGLAHVDTPKGDLNMDGMIGGVNDIVVENSFAYPFGTTERFPRMEDSDYSDQSDSAHYYMECSNKGTCNRETGDCECYDGYDGAACQRASCPGFPDSCSGHGVCKTIKQLAAADYGNMYELWDKETTMGCECDAGYFGADCSERQCKFDIDPLYMDDTATIKYSVFDFAVLTTGTAFYNGMDVGGTGHWAIRFYDMHGEDWLTAPLEAGATCSSVIAALNDLPNDVIPGTMTDDMCTSHSESTPGTPQGFEDYDSANTADNLHTEETLDSRMALWEYVESTNTFSSTDSSTDSTGSVQTIGTVYRIHFNQNPGKLREPEIEIYLDGVRPSLAGKVASTDKVFTKVWTNGRQGETVDYFADHCDGIDVTVVASGSGHQLSDLSAAEKLVLNACLGDANGDDTDNINLEDWDYGDVTTPHLIKLVQTTATSDQGGYYVALYSDSAGDYHLMNKFPPYAATDKFEVYTTKGTLARTTDYATTTAATDLTGLDTGVVVDFASNKFYMTYDETWNGDLSCETASADSKVDYCLNKGDIITFLTQINTGDEFDKNPALINLYTVERLYQETQSTFIDIWTPDNAAALTNGYSKEYSFGRRSHIIETDLSSNFAHGLTGGNADYAFHVYKFFGWSDSAYTVVAECSNRGMCNTETGVCECFNGYTGDACGDQNSLAA